MALAGGDAELQELIQQSFEMVSANAPKKKPVRNRATVKRWTVARKSTKPLSRPRRSQKKRR
jgi:hypothetical protein